MTHSIYDLVESLLKNTDVHQHPELLAAKIREVSSFKGEFITRKKPKVPTHYQDKDAAKSCVELLKNFDGKKKEDTDKAKNGAVLTTNWRTLEKLGVGLPEGEALLLDASIANLKNAWLDPFYTNARFFGKIFGTSGDYYIVEAERGVSYSEDWLQKPPRKGLKLDTQCEPTGKGLNRYVYLVSSSPIGDWVELPDVTPQQINAARDMRKLFTGNLDARVDTYPEFPGLERNYLRAQLARIASSTVISPLGAMKEYEAEEEDEAEEEEQDENAEKRPKVEKYKPLLMVNGEWGGPEEGEEQTDLQYWVHNYIIIDKFGRTTAVPKREEEEEEAEEAKEGEEEVPPEEEEEIKLLHPLNNDKPIYEPPEKKDDSEEGKEEEEPEEEPEEVDEEALALERQNLTVPNWVSRKCNETFKKHKVTFLRSIRWPGAYAYAAEGGKSFSCVYFGNGLKYLYKSFTPFRVQLEINAADIFEKSDPTPLLEKRMLQGEDPADEPQEEPEDEEEEQ